MTKNQFDRLAAALAAQTAGEAEAAGRGVGAGLTGAERARAREAMGALLKAEEFSNEIGGLHIRLHRLLIDAWQQLFDLLLLEPEGGGKEEEK